MNRRELFAFAALVSPQHLLNLTDEQSARKAQDAFAFADKMMDLCDDSHEEDSDADADDASHFAEFRADTIDEFAVLRTEVESLRAELKDALGEKPADAVSAKSDTKPKA